MVDSIYSDVVVWSAAGGWYKQAMMSGRLDLTLTKIQTAETVLLVYDDTILALRLDEERMQTLPPIRLSCVKSDYRSH